MKQYFFTNVWCVWMVLGLSWRFVLINLWTIYIILLVVRILINYYSRACGKLKLWHWSDVHLWSRNRQTPWFDLMHAKCKVTSNYRKLPPPTCLFSLLVQLVLRSNMVIRKKRKTWQMEIKNMVFRKIYAKHETHQNLAGKECLKTQMWRRKLTANISVRVTHDHGGRTTQ